MTTDQTQGAATPARAVADGFPDYSNDPPSEPRDSIAILLDQITGSCQHWTNMRPDADDFIAGLAQRGFRLARAADPAAQTVTISEQTCKTALAVLTERANDYDCARELTPHYVTVGPGTPWDTAIFELSALAGSGARAEGGRGSGMRVPARVDPPGAFLVQMLVENFVQGMGTKDVSAFLNGEREWTEMEIKAVAQLVGCSQTLWRNLGDQWREHRESSDSGWRWNP